MSAALYSAVSVIASQTSSFKLLSPLFPYEKVQLPCAFSETLQVEMYFSSRGQSYSHLTKIRTISIRRNN